MGILFHFLVCFAHSMSRKPFCLLQNVAEESLHIRKGKLLSNLLTFQQASTLTANWSYKEFSNEQGSITPKKKNLRAYAILLSMLREHTARALCLTYWNPTARHAEKEANPLYPVPKLMTKKSLRAFITESQIGVNRNDKSRNTELA